VTLRRRLLYALLALTLALIGCRRETSDKAGSDKKPLRIAVIPKGTTHEFWKAVHAGAVKASRELGAEVVWKGPLREDDLKAQVDLVQSFTAQNVSGIVLAPLNDKALVQPVRAAAKTKIPVVIFDSDLADPRRVSFVATDNRAAGRIAGEQMLKLVGGKGAVIVLRYQEGSASTSQREQGFLDAVATAPGVQIKSQNQYGGATTESAFSASENLLSAHGAASGGVQGVFCPNESTTFGMLLALQKAGLAGKIRFIGFDSSEKLLNGLRAGELDGLVVQDPFRMGDLAVRTMVSHLRGERVEPRIDTGARLVHKDNLDQPEIRELLKPDLARWLGR
jgi:ribose transport system substrate-binding protein